MRSNPAIPIAQGPHAHAAAAVATVFREKNGSKSLGPLARWEDRGQNKVPE